MKHRLTSHLMLYVDSFIWPALGLLQLTFQQHMRWTDDPAAVCPGCCCKSRVGRSTVWRHHAAATPAALASGSEAGGLQDGHLGPALLRLTWPLTVSCRLKVVISCVLTTRGLVSSGGPTALWGPSRFAQGCGVWNSLPAGLRQTYIGYERLL